MQLLVATTSTGKLREIRALLEGTGAELRSLEDLPPVPTPEETGGTFEENARLKALYYAEVAGGLTVAEDSGLEIDALQGAPGVRSARFEGASYAERFARIYRMLEARGARDSPARFVCVVALAEPGRILFEARGTMEGTIAPAPRGSGGFGYDPIFLYPPLGRTTAELTPEEKAAVSHRGRAFRALKDFLEGLQALSLGARR